MIARLGPLLLALLVACAPPDDQETGSIRSDEVRQTRAELPADLLAAIDSGNAAYQRGDYQRALDSYDRAIEIDDDVAAGWFGVYMAQSALGNPEAADSALARAQGLAPGASLIHPEREAP
jgi:tetratricopeptide (TPR) repeat protein